MVNHDLPLGRKIFFLANRTVPPLIFAADRLPLKTIPVRSASDSGSFTKASFDPGLPGNGDRKILQFGGHLESLLARRRPFPAPVGAQTQELSDWRLLEAGSIASVSLDAMTGGTCYGVRFPVTFELG